MSPSAFSVQEHTIPAQHIREYPGATLHNQEDDLKLHIKQYTPRNLPKSLTGAITIIGAHANGFPKELYEPLWEGLHQRLTKSGLVVRSIWIADAAHQGISSVLNEEKLGNDPSWYDHSRDLLHMINHFRKDMHRPIVGVGHSAGGTALVLLSLIHPRLLSSLVLIDPVIQSEEPQPNKPTGLTAPQMSTFRRDLWPSRAAAATAFLKSRSFKSWDPAVMELWIKHGLRDLPTALYPESPSLPSSDSPPVTLRTTKHQEVFTFLRPNFKYPISPNGQQTTNRRTHPDMSQPPRFPFYRPEPSAAVQNLPHLRPSILYIFGGQSELSTPELRQQKMQLTGTGIGGSGGAPENRVKAVFFPDMGHLLVFEEMGIGVCADAAADWLGKEMNRWSREEEEWSRDWTAKSVRDRTTLSEEWEKHMGGGGPRGKKEVKL